MLYVFGADHWAEMEHGTLMGIWHCMHFPKTTHRMHNGHIVQRKLCQILHYNINMWYSIEVVFENYEIYK